MRQIAWLTLLFVTVMVVPRGAWAQDPTPPNAASQTDVPERKATSSAHGVLRVVSDPTSGLSNFDLLAKLVVSKPVQIKAIAWLSREAAKSANLDTRFSNAGFESSSQIAKVSAGSSSAQQQPGVVLIDIYIQSFDERVPAERLLMHLPDALGDRLAQEDTDLTFLRRRIDEQSGQLEHLKQQFIRESDSLYKLEAIEQSTSADFIAQKRQEVVSQTHAAETELAGLRARQQALQEQIAAIGKKVEAEAPKDSVVVELTKAVAIRKALLDTLRKGGVVSLKEVSTAEVELAILEAELAKNRREAALATGGNRLAQLQERLDDTEIEQAVMTAKLKSINDQQKDLKISSTVESKKLEIEDLKHRIREMSDELLRLELKLQNHQPPVVVSLNPED